MSTDKTGESVVPVVNGPIVDDAGGLDLLPIQVPSLADDGGWELTAPGAVSWLSVMELSRNGLPPTDLVRRTVMVVPGKRHKVCVAVTNVLGKMQIYIGDKNILTADDDGYFESVFTPTADTITLGLRCVGRTDAHAIISELRVEAVES